MRLETKFTIFAASLIISSSHLLSLCAASDSEVDDESPFLYKEKDGKGPKEWGQLNPHWRLCETGKFQSPIDLLNRRVHVIHHPGRWKRNYKPSPAVLKNRGHDIMVKWTSDAGKLNIYDTDYNLTQVHWHTPSEHKINGTRYKMELHLVHHSSQGKVAVVAMLYKFGRPDPFLAKFLPHVKSVGHKEVHLGTLDPREIKFGTRKFYRYVGSLTTPPCTEGVIWTVVKRVRRVSKKQVKALRQAVYDGFKSNARPTQPLDGRPVWLYLPPKS